MLTREVIVASSPVILGSGEHHALAVPGWFGPAIGWGVPVKVVVGETDPALSAAVMEQTWLTHFPGAELEVVASAGHYPTFEIPVAPATSIERFLGGE